MVASLRIALVVASLFALGDSLPFFPKRADPDPPGDDGSAARYTLHRAPRRAHMRFVLLFFKAHRTTHTPPREDLWSVFPWIV